MMMPRQPVLFVDLDGTVRFNRHDPEGFINRPEDVAVFAGAEGTLRGYRSEGYLVVGITNQGGVAFGHKTEEGALAEIDTMRALFEEDPFHAVFMCPHHPEGTVGEYRRACPDRKPEVGMILKALEWASKRNLSVDLGPSLVVGDRPEDERLAQNAGLIFVHADDFFGRR